MMHEENIRDRTVEKSDYAWQRGRALQRQTKNRQASIQRLPNPRCKGCRNPMVKHMYKANDGYCGICMIRLFGNNQKRATAPGMRRAGFAKLL